MEDPYFKEFDADIHHGRVIPLDPKDLQQQHEITLFWSGGERGNVTFSTQVDGETQEANADLRILRPDLHVKVTAQQGATPGPAFTGARLNPRDCMGGGAHDAVGAHAWWLQHDGIDFKAENRSQGTVDGRLQGVQLLLNSDLVQNFNDGSRSYRSRQFLVGKALDRCYPYQRGPRAVDQPGAPLGDAEDEPMTEEHYWEDGTTTRGTLKYCKIVHDCRMVLMFRPNGKKRNTQWVPMQEIFWKWEAEAEYTRVFGLGWKVAASKVVPETPRAEDTDRFPEWERNSADKHNSYGVD